MNEKTLAAIRHAGAAYVFLTTDQQCDDHYNAVTHSLSAGKSLSIDDLTVRYVELPNNSFVVIKLNDQTIIYDNGLSDDEVFEHIKRYSPLTLYIPDLTKRDTNYHLSLLTAL